ncbi:GNAT family protein [Actinokineospora globicatena]|uniref:N-acetyltransferase domain-containing protein n=1 Tax=Actinokineospora globicatena TaxID=103729 RepID=A0A9W6QLH0_9PSEU|nr:GNAT family protein [Actinokineospora globicatena]GLW90448.1 hypothetical protein Aglo03_12640 [Actinokineospora globicatena]
MGIEFVRLPGIDPADLIALLDDPAVRKHLPLASGRFDEAACAGFVAAKEEIWAEHGYGPWAFVADGEFVGWGGPQPEGDDVDIALVLHKRAWGLGRAIYDEVVRRVFADPAPDSVTVLLPPSRRQAHALRRLGLTPDGDTTIDGHIFLRFRLRAPR